MICVYDIILNLHDIIYHILLLQAMICNLNMIIWNPIHLVYVGTYRYVPICTDLYYAIVCTGTYYLENVA